MRKLAPPEDPVLRRIHELVPGPSTQTASATARRVLRRVHEEHGAVLHGHYARAILDLHKRGLVVFDIAWDTEHKRTNWHVRLTPACSRSLKRAQDRAPRKSVAQRPSP